MNALLMMMTTALAMGLSATAVSVTHLARVLEEAAADDCPDELVISDDDRISDTWRVFLRRPPKLYMVVTWFGSRSSACRCN